jgi:hypothetical protein
MAKVRRNAAEDNTLQRFYESCGMASQRVKRAIELRYSEPARACPRHSDFAKRLRPSAHSPARRRDQLIKQKKSLCPSSVLLQMRVSKCSAIPGPEWMIAVGHGVQWHPWLLRSDRRSWAATCANATLRSLTFRRC